MLPLYVALVSEIHSISARQLNRVAAALQKQATRDFGPIWNVSAMVSAFGNLDDVPIGYWPIIIQEDIGYEGAAGIHLDKDGQPFSLVQYSSDWSLTASHELLEMLGDPFGNRLIAGPSPKSGQGRVEFLVEVCDPSEGVQYAYQSNGIVVSDFYTPSYFDPVRAPSVRYSFTGAITKPREVLKGGYLSWHEPVTDHWWQLTYFGSRQKYQDLGKITESAQSLRSIIDSMTKPPKETLTAEPKNALLMATYAAPESLEEATNSKAKHWREQIEALKANSPK